jgi:hypothetical protein
MNEINAVRYTFVYLNIWNRIQERTAQQRLINKKSRLPGMPGIIRGPQERSAGDDDDGEEEEEEEEEENGEIDFDVE